MKKDYLVFRLYAPLAAWGTIAVGESRHSANHPGKSSLLGLIGAALGIKRDQEELTAQMATTYRFAIKCLSTGSLVIDYHTTQVPDSVGKFAYRTRRDELILGKERLGTILSNREYRCDALNLVALEADETAPFSLQQISDALMRPKFHLYLGRKSCPLAAPVLPQLVSASGVKEAFDMANFPSFFSTKLPIEEWPTKEDRRYFNLGNTAYYWEGETDLVPDQTNICHDQSLSRQRWQFGNRHENYYQGEAQ